MPSLKPNDTEPVRFPIIYTENAQGHVKCFGKVQQGSIKINDEVILMPDNISVKVSNISIEHNKECNRVQRGELATITLNTHHKVSIGCMLSSTSGNCMVTKRIIVLIEILSGSSDMIVVTKGFRSMIHIHADSTECHVR